MLAALVALAACTEPNPAIGSRVSSWKAMSSDENALVPLANPVTFPPADEWERIRNRGATSSKPEPDDDP